MPRVKQEAVPLEDCDDAELRRRLRSIGTKRQHMEGRVMRLGTRLKLLELNYRRLELEEKEIEVMVQGVRQERMRRLERERRGLDGEEEADVVDLVESDDNNEEVEEVDVDGDDDGPIRVITPWYAPPAH